MTETTQEKKQPTLKEDLEKALAAISVPVAAIEEFELLTISDDAAFLLREVAKKVKERLAVYAQLLEDLLQPDSGLAAMNECSFFNESEHEKIVKNYRELMSILRRFTMADVEATEAAYQSFLVEALPRWDAQKDWLSKVAKQLHDAWKKAEPLHGESGYFG